MLLERPGAPSLEYATYGSSGPWILLPQCNEDWTELGYPEILAEDFRVLVAAPRGCFGSDRDGQRRYRPDIVRDDLLVLADTVGCGSFAIWGYSLTGALAAYVAMRSSRVTALVCGGFPLIDAITSVAERVGPGGSPRSPLDAGFGFGIYSGMSHLNMSQELRALVLPKLAYWGTADSVMSWGPPVDEQRTSLRDCGFDVAEFDGLDHAACLASTDVVTERVTQFLRSALAPRVAPEGDNAD